MKTRICGAMTLKITIALVAAVCMAVAAFAPSFAHAAPAEQTMLESGVQGGSFDIEYVRAVTSENETKGTQVTLYYGDVNENSQVNTGDAVIVLRYASGMAELTDEQVRIGDATRDGRLNTGDAVYILRLAVDLESLVVFEPVSEGCEVVVNYYDAVNKVLVASESVQVLENTTINSNDFAMPEGFRMLTEQSFDITVINGTVSPAYVDFNGYGYREIDGEDYIEISTVAGVMEMRANLNLNFVLTNDITLSSVNPFVPLGWTVDGDYVVFTAFTGILEGNGHTISGLSCNWWDLGACNVGLFAVNEGTIRNLKVRTSTYGPGTLRTYGVYGDRNVGIIAGRNGGTIEACHVYGNVGSSDCYTDKTGGSYDACGGAGGITGSNNGTVRYCSSQADAEGYYWIGGLVGKNFGTIESSYFAGGINSTLNGVFVFDNEIVNVGGIAGGSVGDVENCYVLVTSNIQASEYVGGLFGWIQGGSVKNCYVSLVGGSIAGIDNYSLSWGYRDTSVGTAIAYVYCCSEGNEQLPEGFSTEIWDMNAASFSSMPDLTMNRRPAVIG